MSDYGKDEYMDWATELGVEYATALQWWTDGIVMTADGIELDPAPVGLPKFSEAWYKPVSYTHLTLPTNREV